MKGFERPAKTATYEVFEKLKKDLEKNDKLKKQFKNVRSQEEAVNLAKKLGYNIDKEEIKNNEELVENVLESIAGGKNKVKVRSYNFSSATRAEGENSHVETSVTWDAGRK